MFMISRAAVKAAMRLFVALMCLFGVGSALAFDQAVFDNLDYGIYWYGDQSTSAKATGPTNPYFNPNAPTLIYIHGWQNGKTQKLERETFDRSDASGISQDLTQAWRAAGWNVGIFYWNQFADESEVKDAEAKVYTSAGPRKMRWRKSDGSYVDSGITKSAAQLFADTYAMAMSGYQGSNVRLAGHSLGAQMVIEGGKLIASAVGRGELPTRLRPVRISLLDAAFLADARSYLNNRWPGEIARDSADYLKSLGVIFEALRSSGSTSNGLIGDTNDGLMRKTAFRELKPWYFGALDFTGKHRAAVWHYLWEFQYSPPLASPDSLQAPSAATSDARTRDIMNGTKKAVHDQGVYTKTPADDTYKWQNR